MGAGANSIIVRLLVGVQPLTPGWVRWQFAPQPSSLPSIQATLPSLHGPINVTINNGRDTHVGTGTGTDAPVAAAAEGGTSFFATLTVPVGTAVRVCLPAAYSAVAETSTTLKVDGFVVGSAAEGRMLCAVDDIMPGTHTLVRL